ncbi:hypothetical protein BCON_0400g00070 [Botryotinia convoluta]|uniref:Uncharacterized protein n=1 Tax=Botryotinia convoluta TaxID=54673 RepID=A0A4Z1HK75_9HELO|nr:hypothetical protein BCON_0400g00070 [Botryotinia convoluta]
MNSLKFTDKTDMTTPNNTKEGKTKTASAQDGFKTPPSSFLIFPLGSSSQVKASCPGNMRRALPPSPTVGKRGLRTRNNLLGSQRAAQSLPLHHDILYLRLLEETRRQPKNPRGISSIPETRDDFAYSHSLER